MIFEFLIVYVPEEGTPIRDVLLLRLDDVLKANLNDIDFTTLDGMIRVYYERKHKEANGTLEDTRRVVLGFSVDLPNDTASARTVVDDYCEALVSAPIEHVVKFEDPLLRQELSERAAELFVLEMKLRRVLTVIYLHAYGVQPYDLLREESAKPMNPATEEHMRNSAENEFFFLTFGQYVGLNQRPEVRQVPILLGLIRSHESYEALRAEMDRLPVEDEDDAVFLAGLKERMDAIEAMRNCVAHNRRPSNRVTNNYLNATKGQPPDFSFEQHLDAFLEKWRQAWLDEMDEGESNESRAAREAVEMALEGAVWDEATKTITLFDPDDDRIRSTVDNREDLEQYLSDVAENAYLANSILSTTCYPDGYVEEALEEYEERLERFFRNDEEENE